MLRSNKNKRIFCSVSWRVRLSSRQLISSPGRRSILLLHCRISPVLVWIKLLISTPFNTRLVFCTRRNQKRWFSTFPKSSRLFAMTRCTRSIRFIHHGRSVSFRWALFVAWFWTCRRSPISWHINWSGTSERIRSRMKQQSMKTWRRS